MDISQWFNAIGLATIGIFSGILLLACIFVVLIWLLKTSSTVAKEIARLFLWILVFVSWSIGASIELVTDGINNFRDNRKKSIIKFWGALWRYALVLILWICVILLGYVATHRSESLQVPVQSMSIMISLIGSFTIILAFAQLLYALVRAYIIQNYEESKEKHAVPLHPLIWHQMAIWANLENWFYTDIWGKTKKHKK